MEKEKLHLYKKVYQPLIKEDRRYDWTLSPPDTQDGCCPHHLEKPSWAGELQDQFGTHRRGPNRSWY